MKQAIRWLVVLAGPVLCAFGQIDPPRASVPAVRQQVVATIDAQLAAFRRHDLARAYGYAAAALQLEHPLPLFGAIVQTNYPELWNNRRAEYGIVRDDGATATVLVHVFADGADASYDYTLVKQGDAWRVEDVLRHHPGSSDQI